MVHKYKRVYYIEVVLQESELIFFFYRQLRFQTCDFSVHFEQIIRLDNKLSRFVDLFVRRWMFRLIIRLEWNNWLDLFWINANAASRFVDERARHASRAFVRALSAESVRLNHRPVKIMDRSCVLEGNELRYKTAYSSVYCSRYRFYRIPRPHDQRNLAVY